MKQCFQILRVPEFRVWFDIQTEKSKVQIDDRLSKIQYDAYFGDHKNVSDDKEGVWELRIFSQTLDDRFLILFLSL